MEPEIASSEGIQSSASVLEENFVKTVDQAASHEDVEFFRSKAVTTQKFSRNSYKIVKIVAQLDQITKKPHQLRAVNLKHIDGINRSIKVQWYDYTYGVLTVSTKARPGPVHLWEKFTEGQPTKQFCADFEIAPPDGQPGTQLKRSFRRSISWRPGCGAVLVYRFWYCPPVFGYLYHRFFGTGKHVTTSADSSSPNRHFLETVSKILMCAKMLHLEYGTAFLTARSKTIAEKLQESSFMHGNSLLHVRTANVIVRCPAARSFVGAEPRSDLIILHLLHQTLLSSVSGAAVLLV